MRQICNSTEVDIFVIEQILAFNSSPNMIRKVKKLSNFQTNCITMFFIIKYSFGKLRPIFTLNSKHFYLKLYSDNLYIVVVTCNFL